MFEQLKGDVATLRGFLRTLKMTTPIAKNPMFLRIRDEIEVTGTLKHKKVDVVREGFDPCAIADPIFFYDAVRGAFVRLDRSLHDRILAGDVRM